MSCNVIVVFILLTLAGLLLIFRHAAQFQEYLARDYNVSCVPWHHMICTCMFPGTSLATYLFIVCN